MAPLQPYQPDLAGAFARGLQIREMMEAGRDRDRKRRGREALEAGDMELFARLDPEGYAAVAKSQREGEKAQLDAMNIAQQMGQRDMEMLAKRDDNTRAFQERVANALRSDPTAAGRWQQVIEQRARGRNPAINAFDVPGEHLLADGLAGPQVLPTDQEIETLRLGAGGKDERTGDQKDFEYGEQNPRFRAYEMAKKKAGAASNNITVGGTQDPTTAFQTQLQKDIEQGQGLLSIIDQTNSIKGRPDFLTYRGAATKWVARRADKLGLLPEAQKQRLRDQRIFEENVNQLFDRYRIEVTGAGAQVAELERLKNSMLNTDLSPEEFEASWERYQTIIREGVARKQRMLHGVPVNSPDQGRDQDREYTRDDFK